MADDDDGDDLDFEKLAIEIKIEDKPPPAVEREGGQPPATLEAVEGGDIIQPYFGRGLPPDSPVTALGQKGRACFYLDPSRQIIGMMPSDHNAAGISKLFGGDTNYLRENWPHAYVRQSKPDGWDVANVRDALMQAAHDKGIWEPQENERGLGCWIEDGDLLWHCGDQLYRERSTKGVVQVEALEPGRIGSNVYPGAQPMPAPMPPSRRDNPVGQRMLDLFAQWNFARSDLDALFMLGFCACGFLGGALRWRPMVWITGGRGTGKSTLHDVLREFFGPWLLSVSDLTAAAVRQILHMDARPVAVDEFESEEDNRAAYDVMKMMRQSSSGGRIIRGGAEHKGAQFMVRSCFLFSSIMHPPLLGQDRSRFAMLELGPLDPGADVDYGFVSGDGLGQHAMRRLIDQWPRYFDTLSLIRSALLEAGHDARSADQFGGLLAGADLMLQDRTPDSDTLEALGERMAAGRLLEKLDDGPEWEKCIDHLWTKQVEPSRGARRRPLGAIIKAAFDDRPGSAQDRESARDVLATFGLRPMHRDGVDWLAVANNHQGLQTIFTQTQWGARSGTSGVWVQALRRMPDALTRQRTYFDGRQVWCTLLPVDHLMSRRTDEQNEG